MAKSKKRTKSKKAAKINWGGKASSGTGRFNLILGLVAAAAVIAGGVYWWQGRAVNADFMALASQGQAALEQVESFPNLGRTHLRPGEAQAYGTSTPTSGPHSTSPTSPGFYESPQPPANLLHSMEHGMVVLYYDEPAPEVMAQIKSWASLFTGRWDGMAVSRLSGLGPNIIVTAWRKKLDLAPFDPAAAAAFIDAYRGRGPENPVR
jgi:Protein of unknown function (DUF3105)